MRLRHWGPSLHVVEFNRGAFCFRDVKKETPFHDCKYLERGGVVGNIYENPELLTK